MNDANYSELNWASVRAESPAAGLLAITVGEMRPADGGRQPAGGGLAETLLALLIEAERSLTADTTSAKWSIARARSLLEAGRREEPAPSAPRPIAMGGLTPRTVQRLESYIDEHLENPITISVLSQVARLSARHFSYAFSQSFGQSPHSYVIRRRIERAKQLMARTDDPLCQIALDCGLADQSHLTKLFRRLLGVTPSVWRKAQLA